jgi:hypothetical protein
MSSPNAGMNDASSDRQGGISQTTEHLLIAAGSIGKIGSCGNHDTLLILGRRDYRYCYDHSSSLHHAQTWYDYLGRYSELQSKSAKTRWPTSTSEV